MTFSKNFAMKIQIRALKTRDLKTDNMQLKQFVIESQLIGEVKISMQKEF